MKILTRTEGRYFLEENFEVKIIFATKATTTQSQSFLATCNISEMQTTQKGFLGG